MSDQTDPRVRRRWRRPAVLVPVGILVAGALTVALLAFEPWTLLTDEVVDEAAPQPVTSVAVPSPTATPTSTAEASTPGAPSPGVASPEPSNPATAPEPVVLASGTFISHEHPTSGAVRVLELADGTRVLRIEGLDTSNGPDLHVWLSDAPVVAGPGGWTVFDDGAYVELGALKGNRGNQNYALPADVDLDALSSVTIWCKRFHVSFGAAQLA